MQRLKESLMYGMGKFQYALTRVLANIDAEESSESSVEMCPSDCSQCASENFHLPENDGEHANDSLFGSGKSSLKKFKPNSPSLDDKENSQILVNELNKLSIQLNSGSNVFKSNQNQNQYSGNTMNKMPRNPFANLSANDDVGGEIAVSGNKKRKLCEISQDNGQRLNASNMISSKNQVDITNNKSMDQAKQSSKICKHQVISRQKNETDKATKAKIDHMSVLSICNQMSSRGILLCMRKEDQMKRLKRQIMLSEKEKSNPSQLDSKSAALVSMQLKNLDINNKMLIDNSVLSTRDLQTSPFFQEMVQELFSEYHMVRYVSPVQWEQEASGVVQIDTCSKKGYKITKKLDCQDLGLSAFEINVQRINKIFDLILNKQKDASNQHSYDGLDQIIINRKIGYTLNRRSFQALVSKSNGKNQLSSQVIDAYVGLINHRDQEFQKNNLFCFDSLFYQRLQRADSSFKNILDQVVQHKKKFQDLSSKELITCPVQLPGTSHWLLLCASMKLCKVFVVDSVFHNQDQANKLSQVFKNFLEQLVKDQSMVLYNPQVSSWQTNVVIKAPSLQNPADSGVFACLNLEKIARYTHLLSSEKTFGYSQFNADEGRKRITVEILTGKLTTE